MPSQCESNDERLGRYLVIRPFPRSGELTCGYLVRIALANGFNSPLELCRAIRMRGVSLHLALRLPAAGLGCLTGPFPRYCREPLVLPHGLRNEDFNYYSMRWCPACLAESEYLRGEWGLKLFCVCVRHAVKLMDRCPNCLSIQRLERGAIATCVCGSALNRVSAEPVEAPLLALHQILVQVLTQESGNNSELSPTCWLRLIKYLGPFELNPLAKHPGQRKGLHQLHVALELATGAAILLAEWPKNFIGLLRRIRAARPSDHHIGDAFGQLYHVLYKSLSDSSFDFLRSEFEAYLHENWFGLLGRRNRRLRPATIEAHPHRATKEIAQNACASKVVVRRLASLGLIRSHAVRHASGRTSLAVHREEANLVAACRSDSLSLREAASMLRLKRERVRELVDAGLLRAWIDRRKTGASAWWLSKQDASRLLSIATLDEPVEDACSYLPLARILRTWRLRVGEFPALVRALLEGEVRIGKPMANHGGLGGVRISTVSLCSWLDVYRTRERRGMSVDAAAKKLGIKQEVAYQLVRGGLLSTEVQDGARRISQDAIESFRQCYVSLVELAASRKMSPRKLLSILPTMPVCGPGVDGTRQYFYRREEVKEEQMDDSRNL